MTNDQLKIDAFVVKVSEPIQVGMQPVYNWHYEYDGLSRLIYACSQWDSGTSACLGESFGYEYDGAGNALSFSRWSGSMVETVSFIYNSANQILCQDGNANGVCGEAGDIPYSYDAYGNLTNDGVKSYTYDAQNRLVSVNDGVSTTGYTYNGDGDRVSQTVDGLTTNYVLDTAAPLTMVLAETTGSETVYYLHGLNLAAQSDGVSTEYFGYDGLGSVRQMLDEMGEVLFVQVYDPYGNPFDRAGTSSTRFGFTGEQEDGNGLVFLRARFYNPYITHFIQRDPIVPNPDKPKEWNPYTYAKNNPVRYTDPSGKTSIIPLAKFEIGEDYNGPWQPDGSYNSDGDNRPNYVSPGWQQREKGTIYGAIWDVAQAYSNAYKSEIIRRYQDKCLPAGLLLITLSKVTPYSTFLKVHGGPITFVRTAENATQYFSQQKGYLIKSGVWANTEYGKQRILIFKNAKVNDVVNNPRWIVHEVGHAFENAILETLGAKVGREGLGSGLICRTGAILDPYCGFAGGKMEWQFSTEGTSGEIFADMFVGWVYNRWWMINESHLSDLASERADYMNNNMPVWIYSIIRAR